VARRLVVRGRVQGVFYRASMRTEADRLGVRGWVRNEEDGTVHAHVEGSAEDVDALVEWCRSGPPRAQVSGVDVTDAEPVGARGFED
jgi:acylphosphatase